MSEHPLYAERADLYDAIYAWKDYAAEADQIVELLASAGVGEGSRVLEAACGTGAFLVPLSSHFRVAGFDRSPEMIAIARSKLSDIELTVAELEHYEAAEPYDAVLCLFSSIGYLRDDAALQRTARRFAAALRPGGVLVIEPWIDREDFVDGMPFLQTAESDDRKIARASVSRIHEEFAAVDFRWVVANRGGPLETFAETHELRFVPEATLLSTLADAGIRAKRVEVELSPNRGLIVGKRSE